MNDLEFIVLLDGAYPNVPHSSARKSNYINLPTTNFDPLVGQRVLSDQLEVLALAEDLGYDGVMMTEQHGGPIGILGNAMLAGAWLAARTKNIRICTVGPLLNAYLTPVRLAEEVAVVDLMSGGRLTLGLPMGIGAQYHSYGVMNPALGRERFREAHELLIKAMTDPGPFEWKGKYFHVPYVNLWPRPLQQPHPPIFIPAAGSRETLAMCARHHYTYQAVLTPRPVLLRNCELFRELCREEGYEADPKQIAAVIHVHVAETDKQARLEAEGHMLWQYQNFFRSPFEDSFPPGHVSVNSLRGMAAGAGYRSKDMAEMDWDDLIEANWLVAGSPKTVAERLDELTTEMHAGRLILAFNSGSLDRWLVTKSMTIFAEQVLPRFRPDGLALWQREKAAGYQTNAEYAARRPGETVDPVADFGEPGMLPVREAHVEDLRRA
jgi:alkanesulfonate monooxygenase SsuD/methylene tetrahydromethanopterin reductase-like flavin-dependent oxidoreductase (luciferase family)